ncbi:AraC family transcriptional regulator ligand-binding domain-containing protein [Sphingomonas sp. S6]|jgi:AraC-like DNA-binding protein|uniref:AraC family transcriptional regulator n=1 Tax=Sphingomonas sp. S6 TaxID=3368600 RepID=UPI0028E90898|nr:AraC family transcriptional regulator ligand-binding domain-containing protein [uncultured Sphingomonas sp.]
MDIIRVAGLDGYAGLVESMGGSAFDLQRLHSFAGAGNESAERYYRFHDVFGLLERTADVLNARDFGLRLAERQGLNILGALGLAMRNAPTVRSAHQKAERFIRYHSPAIRVGVEPLPGGEFELISFDILRPDALRDASRQTFELSIGLTFRNLKTLADGLCRPRAIWFQHEPLSTLARYRDLFGITPSFRKERSGIVVSRNDLDRPIAGNDTLVREIAEHYLIEKCPVTRDTITDEVTRIVAMVMRERDCSQAEAAELLGLKPRTLQRRLTDENTNFETIRDGVRATMARELLRSTNLSLTTISERLCYAEPSTFTRSCRRWFGQSPRDFRRAATQTASGSLAGM